ncbi:MAG: hypothetical protein HYW48_08755 [Deltaproteobacteria bacterium]|nr:hypothetical protein [Deltaproteobacteria bacterium]
MSNPSTNGDIGRDAQGRFAKGNSGGPGNPHIRRVASFRRTLLSSVSEGDVNEIVAALVKSAKNGNIAAARFVISYVIGSPADIENDRQKILLNESMGSFEQVTTLNYPTD